MGRFLGPRGPHRFLSLLLGLGLASLSLAAIIAPPVLSASSPVIEAPTANIAPKTEPVEIQAIDFVYVHGVNTHKKNSHALIQSRFTQFHANLIESFEEDPVAANILTNNGQKFVSQAPSLFYWNQLNQESIVEVNDSVILFKALQSRISSMIQDNLATMMHDVFWLVRRSNQLKIGTSLNKHLVEEVPKEHQVVLVGYSGGSIITYDYLLYYLPYINLYKILQKGDLPKDLVDRFEGEEHQHTCLRAVLDSNFARQNPEGEVILFLDQLNVSDKKLLERLNHAYVREHIPLLFDKTKEVCLPDKRIRGLITFGSPITALSATEKDSDVDAKLAPAMVKYLFEHNIFWLNLNRINDPLGLPFDDTRLVNLTKKEYQWEIPKETRGFIYNNITRKKGAYFYKAHTWYLSQPKDFSEFVVESLKTGYNQYYQGK